MRWFINNKMNYDWYDEYGGSDWCNEIQWIQYGEGEESVGQNQFSCNELDIT